MGRQAGWGAVCTKSKTSPLGRQLGRKMSYASFRDVTKVFDCRTVNLGRGTIHSHRKTVNDARRGFVRMASHTQKQAPPEKTLCNPTSFHITHLQYTAASQLTGTHGDL